MPTKKINYTPQKGEITAMNHFIRLLPSMSMAPTRKKTPKNLAGCVKLDYAHRAILFQQFFNLLPCQYNKSIYQYAMQLQRYFRKLDQQIYNNLSPKLKKKVTLKKMNLLTDPIFDLAKQALNSKMVTSQKEGYKSSAKDYDDMDAEKCSFLLLNLDIYNSPRDLLDSAIIHTGISCAKRGYGGLYGLKQGDFTRGKLDDGRPSIVFEDRSSKTNQGGLNDFRHDPLRVDIFMLPGISDNKLQPYFVLDRYLKSLPSSIRNNKRANLFKTPNSSFGKNGIGFNSNNRGVKMVGTVVKTLAKKFGLPGIFRNHSLKAVRATSLFECGLNPELVKKSTGHRSSAVNAYDKTSTSMKEERLLQTFGVMDSRLSWKTHQLNRETKQDK